MVHILSNTNKMSFIFYLLSRILKTKSHIFSHLAIQLLHLYLELCLQVVDMFLILENFFPQLVPLIQQGLMLSPQFLVISFALACQVLFDLVCEVLV